MKAAIYARVSTSDKDQNPGTQLLPLREFVQAQGWTVAGEFVDHASATDLRGRTADQLLADLRGACERDLADAAVAEDGLGDHTRSARGDEVDDAWRQADLIQQLKSSPHR